ncbi:MAG: ATP synthase F1 subunit epsilon [Planctomycetota bacterium]
MAKEAPIHCLVITPEEQVLDTQATSVVMPAHDGQTGILKNRAPLLCELGTGVLRVDGVDTGPKEYFVDGGFAQVLHNELTLLTERAAAADDIVRADAEKELAEASQMPAHDLQAVAARDRAMARAKARLRIAKK